MDKSYKKLIVWQRSMQLVNEIYTLTNKLPTSEKFGLVTQMRRCATSIPSNIAEGYKRRSLAEYIHFLSISDASAAELETQIAIIQSNYDVSNCKQALDLLTEVQKMLYVLIRKLSESKTIAL